VQPLHSAHLSLSVLRLLAAAAFEYQMRTTTFSSLKNLLTYRSGCCACWRLLPSAPAVWLQLHPVILLPHPNTHDHCEHYYGPVAHLSLSVLRRLAAAALSSSECG
jgi:hypothetical protein